MNHQEAQTNFQILNYEQELQNLERVLNAMSALAMRIRSHAFRRCLLRS